MVVTLISMLGMTCVTGYLMTTDAYWGSKVIEDVHGALADATMVLVVLHVLGVLAASLEHRENLAKSMFPDASGHLAPA
jgi:cytochrome b